MTLKDSSAGSVSVLLAALVLLTCVRVAMIRPVVVSAHLNPVYVAASSSTTIQQPGVYSTSNQNDQQAAQILSNKVSLPVFPYNSSTPILGSFIVGGPIPYNWPSWFVPVTIDANDSIHAPNNQCSFGPYYIGSYDNYTFVFGFNTLNTMTAAQYYPNCPPTTTTTTLTTTLTTSIISSTNNQVTFYIAAHPDDWMLLLAPRADSDVQSGTHVVFVYTTAGDAGLGCLYSDTVCGGSNYWLGREQGAQASIIFLISAPSRVNGTVTINGHSIHTWTYGNTISYDLRLPDGNGNGNGFPQTGNVSLAKLRNGEISNIIAVDGSTRYTSWQDLVDTISQIIITEINRYPSANVWVNSQEYNSTLSPNDHSDHYTTGYLTYQALIGLQVSQAWFVGYDINNRPVDLNQSQINLKNDTVYAYYNTVQQLTGHCTVCESPGAYGGFVLRQYYRASANTQTTTTTYTTIPPATTIASTTTATTTASTSTTATTSASTTIPPQEIVNVSGNYGQVGFGLSDSMPSEIDLNNGQATLFIQSPESGAFNITITNMTTNATALLAGYDRLLTLKINISSTLPQKPTLKVLTMMKYDCSIPSGRIAPYIMLNGIWEPITPYSVDASACSVSFNLLVDPIVALFEIIPTTTTTVSTTTIPQQVAPSYFRLYIILAMIALLVLAVVARLLLKRRRKDKKK